MKYLFISPHVDDCIISCGATISKLYERNHDITHLSLSKFYSGVDLSYEFNKSNEQLGCSGFISSFTTRKFYLQYDDILQELFQQERLGYDFIFAPSSVDFHMDHETVGKAAKRVFKKSNLITYKGDWNTRDKKINYFQIVDKAHVENKIKALLCFKSQQDKNYINPDYSWANALNTGALVSGIGAGAGALASYGGAQLQADAAREASANQLAMFNTINKQFAPQRGAGYQSLNQIRSMLPGQSVTYNELGQPIGTQEGTDYLTRQFTPQDLQSGLAPNYQFMLQQGQNLNQRQANLSGGAIGGNALRGLEEFTQNYAGNAYQGAFNNFQSQRTGIYNTLAGIAGLGQKAQESTSQAGQNATTAAAQLGVGSAAAQAAGLTGASNALAGGLQNYQQNQILQAVLGQNQNVAQQTPGYYG